MYERLKGMNPIVRSAVLGIDKRRASASESRLVKIEAFVR